MHSTSPLPQGVGPQSAGQDAAVVEGCQQAAPGEGCAPQGPRHSHLCQQIPPKSCPPRPALFQIKFVHRWYPDLVPQLDRMLPQSALGQWLYNRLLGTMKLGQKDARPGVRKSDPRGFLYLRRSHLWLLAQKHKYLGVFFHDVGTDYTTPQRLLSIATMVFTVGFLVCGTRVAAEGRAGVH